MEDERLRRLSQIASNVYIINMKCSLLVNERTLNDSIEDKMRRSETRTFRGLGESTTAGHNIAVLNTLSKNAPFLYLQ